MGTRGLEGGIVTTVGGERLWRDAVWWALSYPFPHSGLGKVWVDGTIGFEAASLTAAVAVTTGCSSLNPSSSRTLFKTPTAQRPALRDRFSRNS